MCVPFGQALLIGCLPSHYSVIKCLHPNSAWIEQNENEIFLWSNMKQNFKYNLRETILSENEFQMFRLTFISVAS